MRVEHKHGWGTWVAFATLALAACGGEEVEAPRSSPIAQLAAVEPAEDGSNRAPEILSVQIVPDAPVPGDTLQAAVDARDADGDQPTLHFVWSVDGMRQGSGSAMFELTDIGRGANIELTVVARDALGESEPFRARVVVGNQPPVVTALQLEPQEVRSDFDISVHPQALDRDGDSLSYRYRWWVNEVEVDESGSILSSDQFERGDRVEIEVVARDGDAESEPLRSSPIEVQNAPPEITSTPGNFDADGAYRYALVVEDPDGDRSFGYRLLDGPSGMALDPSDGVLSWRPRQDQAGSHSVKLEVSDRYGASTVQAFDLDLSFQPVASSGY